MEPPNVRDEPGVHDEHWARHEQEAAAEAEAKRALTDPCHLAGFVEFVELDRLRKQAAAPCELVHIPCGACGHEIRQDGTCGCFDNRHPIGKFQQTTLGELADENAKLRERLDEAVCSSADLGCDIASAFNWELEGEPFADAVRRVVADNKRLLALGDAELAGMTARLDGEPENANPHGPDTPESAGDHVAWEHGWHVQDNEVRLQETEAVVDKLPKTADGVSVKPDDEVWVLHNDGTIEQCVVWAVYPYKVAWTVRDSQGYEGAKLTSVYSTREATEAAGEKEK